MTALFSSCFLHEPTRQQSNPKLAPSPPPSRQAVFPSLPIPPIPSSLHPQQRIKNSLIIPPLQRIPRQATKHQPRNRRPDTALPVPLRRLLRDDGPRHRADHARADPPVRRREMLLGLVEPVRRRRRRRILVGGALLRGAVGRALVFGRGARAAARGVAGGFAVVAAGPGFEVVASAVAHVRRWRVVVVAVVVVVVVVVVGGGVVGLVSSARVACWVIAVGLPLAVVRVRHANGTVQMGYAVWYSLAVLVVIEVQMVASQSYGKVGAVVRVGQYRLHAGGYVHQG